MQCCKGHKLVQGDLLGGASEDGVGVHFSSQQLRDGYHSSTLLDVKEQ